MNMMQTDQIFPLSCEEIYRTHEFGSKPYFLKWKQHFRNSATNVVSPFYVQVATPNVGFLPQEYEFHTYTKICTKKG